MQQFEVLLLVGAGIGVTPFASVMADLINRMEAERAYAAAPKPVSRSLASPSRSFLREEHGLLGSDAVVLRASCGAMLRGIAVPCGMGGCM